MLIIKLIHKLGLNISALFRISTRRSIRYGFSFNIMIVLLIGLFSLPLVSSMVLSASAADVSHLDSGFTTGGDYDVQKTFSTITEEFDSDVGFTFTDPDLYIQNGKAYWTVYRDGGEQYLYRSIPEVSGPIKITVVGQVNSATNNCHVEAGIGDSLGTGPEITFGWFGGGCSVNGYNIRSSVPLNLDPHECIAGTAANWLWINGSTEYTAILTLDSMGTLLDVPGVGSVDGPVYSTGTYDTLYVGLTGGGDWPSCSGTIERMIIEPLADTTPPTVDSVTRADTNPTAASTVDFTVIFSESVTGVDTTDFNLTTTGVTGSSITGLSGSGSSYTITVGTGSGNGTIRLDVLDDDSIVDTAGNLLNGGFTGEEYIVEEISSAITEEFDSDVGFTFTDPDLYIQNGKAYWTVQRNGGVQYLYRSIPEVSGPVKITVVGQVNSATNNCHVEAGIGDSLGIGPEITFGWFGGGCPVNGYNIRSSVPLNLSPHECVEGSASDWLWINGSTEYTATLTLDSTGTLLEVSGVGSVDGPVYSTGTYDTLYVGLTGGGDWPSCSGTIERMIIEPLADTTPPTVASVTRSDTNPTAASSVDFTVIFTESVTGVDITDFSLTTTGMTLTSITALSGSGDSYTVTADTGYGNGTIRLDVLDDASIIDLAGNSLVEGFIGEEYIIADWRVIVVDSNDDSDDLVSTYLDIDGNGYPHIAYQDYTNLDLKYAATDGATWSIVERVQEDGNTGYDPVIAVDNNNIPHFAWKDYAGTRSLWYGTPLGDNFSNTMIHSGAWPKSISIAMDSANNPHISYWTDGGDDLTHAWFDGSTWQREVVKHTVHLSMFTSIVIDSLDRPHIAYSYWGDTTLNHTYFDGTTWQFEVVSADIYHYGPVSLDLDANDNPHIVHQDGDGNNLEYFWYDGSAWQHELLGNATYSDVSIKLDSNNNPHIGYYLNDGLEQLIRYAYQNQSTWVHETIALGTSQSLALTPAGVPGISFINSSGQLAYASRTFEEVSLSVSSIIRRDLNPTNAPRVDFTVTFTEPVFGVDETDFSLTTNIDAASIALVSGSGDTYIVSVNTGAGSGYIRLDLIDDDSITDIMGNLLGGSGENNGDFSRGESYDYAGSYLCGGVQEIAAGEIIYDTLQSADDINVYKIMVSEPYTFIAATLTPPASGDFILDVFNECDTTASNPWIIGRRGWHIGRRGWHIGVDQDRNDSLDLNVGEAAGRYYYLTVKVPEGGSFDGTLYNLKVELSVPNVYKTLILFNRSRFEEVYDVDTASQIMDSLVQLAKDPKVNGRILQLDQFPDIQTAYGVWDDVNVGNTDSYGENVNAANAVVDAIKLAVGGFLKDGDNILTDYIIIVGDDHQIPFYRYEIGPDTKHSDPSWATEDEYFEYIRSKFGEEVDSPIEASLVNDLTLTDSEFSDIRTKYLPWPSFSVGRLLDPPSIEKNIKIFFDSNGVIDLTTPDASAVVASYQFLVGPAQELCNKLADSGWDNLNCDFFEPPLFYSGSDLYGAFITAKPDMVAHYGHASHWQMLSPNETDPALTLTAGKVSMASEDLSGALWLGVGCHTGLIFTAGDEEREYAISLPQALAGKGVTFIGNTGWAWGEGDDGPDDPPVYTELLFKLITDRLTLGGSVTIGDAFLYARRNYIVQAYNSVRDYDEESVGPDYYDEKVIAQATLYGLPMLEYNFPESSPASGQALQNIDVFQEIQSAVSATTNSQFHFYEYNPGAIQFEKRTHEDDSYYTNLSNDGEYSATYNRPILPHGEYLNFETSGGTAKGILWKGGVYDIRANENPFIVQPTQFNGTPGIEEPEFMGTYPLLPVSLIGGVRGDRGYLTNYLTYLPAQYQGNQDVGDFRLFSRMEIQFATWDGDGGEDILPALGTLIAATNNDQLHIELPVMDNSGIYKAYLTYTEIAEAAEDGVWQSAALETEVDICTPGQQTFSLDLDLPIDASIEYFIQVMDCAGNVSRIFDGDDYFRVSSETPYITSITRVDTNPTNATSVDFTVTFSEDVNGVDSASPFDDFTLTTTGISGASITSVTSSGAIYTVTVDTGSGDGTIRLDVNGASTDIEDLAGNPLNGGFTSGEEYSIDKTAPDTSLDSQPADPNSSADASFGFSSTNGTATFECQLDGGGYAACASIKDYTSLSDGEHTFDVRATDIIGNTDATPASYTWDIDTAAPTVLSSTRVDSNPTNAQNVDFAVTFDESVTGVDTADFALTTTGVTGASIVSRTGSGDTYIVTVDTGSGDGTIRLDVNASGTDIEDLAGNPLDGGFTTGETYTIDKIYNFENPASRWTTAFDYNHGWRVDSHPRMFADVNGDGYDDALGFGLDGVYVALSDGSSIAASATKWTSAFDYNHGWRVDSHPRMFADVNGDGYDDAVGFGLDGIYVALSDGSSFAAFATKWTSAFDYNHGWRVDQHPRMFADVNGDGYDDAVGFGLDGVYVALSDGSSIADTATKWTGAFDYASGWRVDSHPRMLADVDGDGNADALGFGLDGIYVALSDGSSFAASATKWTSAFDYNHGWRVDQHPRMFADVNGDGYADALGFGLDGVYVALSDGSSFAASASQWTTAFDYNHGWRVDQHPRMAADVNGDGSADALGFGLDGIYVALAE